MLFDSLDFLAFLAVAWLGYRALPSARARRVLLLGASYLFYASWDPRFLGLVWLSTVLDFAAGQGIARARSRGDRRPATAWLLASVAGNLTILGIFKYFDFFGESLNVLLRALGVPWLAPTLGLVLPVGISFYTFQTMSYTIDVYRGRVAATDDAVGFALFVAFCPQLLAGPIERAGELLPQVQAPPQATGKQVHAGLWRFGIGLVKKVVVANSLAPYTDWVLYQGHARTAPELYLGLIAFYLRLYGDFSGYSDMAVGMGRLFGIELRENFRRPFLARWPNEFWRRWHVTLIDWFRVYVLSPLARRGRTRAGRAGALLVTALLVGLWHGAAWTFALFGAGWGVVLLLGHTTPARWRAGPAGGVVGWILTQHVVLASMIAFTASGAADMLGRVVLLASSWQAPPQFGADLSAVAWLSLPIVIEHVAVRDGHPDPVVQWTPWTQAVLACFLILLLWAAHGGNRVEHVYFNF